jgi:hypothetical protein
MPTPKPGQIRCPTCHRPTPPAAFCTQCGAAIPASAHPRPRGMDRNELDQKIRQRRPGESSLRRGTPLDEAAARTSSSGYVTFAPELEDAMALREADAEQPAANVDNTPADFDRSVPPPAPAQFEQPAAYEPPAAQPAYEPQAYEPQAYEPQAGYAQDEDQAPYGAPEDAYPYPAAAYAGGDGRRPGGSSALPIIGFIVLCVLALGVGAVLAGMLGGNGGVGQETVSPSVSQADQPSVEPSADASGSTPGQASATPEPTDGPITFPDGAIFRVQPCASREMSFGQRDGELVDGCARDGSIITRDTMWVWIGFKHANGDDNLVLTLESDGQTVDQQETELGTILNCPDSCDGYLVGAAYKGLEPGEYRLIVRRDGDFADSATFTVEG